MEQAAPVSLEDLSSCTVNVNLKLPYGRRLRLPLYIPSYTEWNEVAEGVREPVMPRTLVDKAGNKTPNPWDINYQRAKRKADDERTARRLVLALTRAGNEIPGDTFDEQVKNFGRSAGADVVNALVDFLSQAVFRGEARVIELADSFRGDGDELVSQTAEYGADAQADVAGDVARAVE